MTGPFICIVGGYQVSSVCAIGSVREWSHHFVHPAGWRVRADVVSTQYTSQTTDMGRSCGRATQVSQFFFFWTSFGVLICGVVALVSPSCSHSRIEYMIKAKSQFKSRSIANNVEIVIPVPRDVDSPSFKASIGTGNIKPIFLHISAYYCIFCHLVTVNNWCSLAFGDFCVLRCPVTYYPDKDAIVWSIKQFTGTKEYLMRAHFGLPSIAGEEGKAPCVLFGSGSEDTTSS